MNRFCKPVSLLVSPFDLNATSIISATHAPRLAMAITMFIESPYMYVFCCGKNRGIFKFENFIFIQNNKCTVAKTFKYHCDANLKYAVKQVGHPSSDNENKKHQLLSVSQNTNYSHIPNSRTYTFIYFPENRRPIRSY